MLTFVSILKFVQEWKFLLFKRFVYSVLPQHVQFKNISFHCFWSYILAKQEEKQVLSSLDIEGVAELIRENKANRVIVMCGAGISTSAGIPDFRSPGNCFFFIVA